MNPKVSVIVPMYNMEKYIERCAKSLFLQTYQDVEYIFVDDCSTDNTVQILQEAIEKYGKGKNVRLERQQENQGLAATRWFGLTLAHGEYVAQVDSDDYVEPDYVQELFLKATDNNADIVVCDFWYDYGSHIVLKNVDLPETKDLCMARLMTGEMHNGLWNKLIRRSLYTEHGIHPIPGINMFEDKSVMFKIFYYCSRINYVSKPLYFYNRVNPNSVSFQSKFSGIPQGIQVTRIIDDFFRDKSPNPLVVQSIIYFKIGILGAILLYGNEAQRAEYSPLVGKLEMSDILKQPVVPFYYKIAIIANKFRCRLTLKFLRLMLSLAKGILTLKNKRHSVS